MADNEVANVWEKARDNGVSGAAAKPTTEDEEYKRAIELSKQEHEKVYIFT